MGSEAVEGAGVRHTAMIIDADAELRTVLLPELRRSAGRYDEILLVVGDRTRTMLDSQVGGLAGVVRWGDRAAFYQRLGLAYEEFRRYLAEQHTAGRRVHVVAEPNVAEGVGAGSRVRRAAAYLAYESICNETYAPFDAAVTCLWNRHDHPGRVLDGVRATHAFTLTTAGAVPSSTYLPPQLYLTEHHDMPWPATPATTDYEIVLTGVAHLSGIRSALRSWATQHQFADDPADDLVAAVMEVVVNGLRHGGIPVRLRAWRDDDTLIVQSDDSAGRPIPATAGYHRPSPVGAAPDGRGLWLARQLADVVLTRSEPARTCVRLHFPYRVMHRNAA
jgi:anti-sigma regulatory factor (Ser/Thr protein kinase)